VKQVLAALVLAIPITLALQLVAPPPPMAVRYALSAPRAGERVGSDIQVSCFKLEPGCWERYVDAMCPDDACPWVERPLSN
jgi:hypothetical protein